VLERLRANRFTVPVLLAVIAVLSAVIVYQNRIIAQQSFEIRWLMANPNRK
jgi:hypothetical protein